MKKEEFLKKMIKEKGFNLRSFSEKIDIPYTTLATILTRNINGTSVDNALKITRGLGITIEELDELHKKSLGGISGEKEDSSRNITKRIVNTIQIPYYEDIISGALATINEKLENEITLIELPEMFFNTINEVDKLIAFRVNTESMNKIIPRGSIVVAEFPSPGNLKDDDILIFSNAGQYSMKRYIEDSEGKNFIFSPESTDKKFRDTIIPRENGNDLKVFSKVIWYGVSGLTV